MLDRRDNEPWSIPDSRFPTPHRCAIAVTSSHRDVERKIVRFAATAGEDESIGIAARELRAEQFGNLFPRILESPICASTFGMLARRVGVLLRFRRRHGCRRFGQEPRG